MPRAYRQTETCSPQKSKGVGCSSCLCNLQETWKWQGARTYQQLRVHVLEEGSLAQVCAGLQGSISSIQMVMAISLIIGCGVASTTLWWFSQRYIGEMSLVVPNELCFSVLDFWGNRQVDLCPVTLSAPCVYNAAFACCVLEIAAFVPAFH